MRARFLSTAVATTRSRVAVPLHSLRTPPTQSCSNAHSLPPVVLIHGVMASEATYRSLQKRRDFAPIREKIGIDLCNHGMSPHVPADEMTYEEMADDVVTLLDKLDVPSACLVGHSMGGKVAMQTALMHAERVSELVVVDIAPITYPTQGAMSDAMVSARAMAELDLDSMTSRADVDRRLTELGVKAEPVRQFLMTNLVRDEATDDADAAPQYRWKANVQAIASALPGIMSFPDHTGRSYDGRTCVIRGGKSPYVPFQAMRQFTQLFPKTKLVTISEAGHWVQAQMPNEFISSVNDFLGD